MCNALPTIWFSKQNSWWVRKWTGIRDPIPWPPSSPDLTPFQGCRVSISCTKEQWSVKDSYYTIHRASGRGEHAYQDWDRTGQPTVRQSVPLMDQSVNRATKRSDTDWSSSMLITEALISGCLTLVRSVTLCVFGNLTAKTLVWASICF